MGYSFFFAEHIADLRYILSLPGYTEREVMDMSYIGPAIKSKFDSLSDELKSEILSRNVRLENLSDLIGILERIVSDSESPS